MTRTNTAADRDQLTFQNPVTRYPTVEPPIQHQPEPGLDAELEPEADHGESSYRGTGRLTGRKALITGGDSGIGAAVAIAFAREGGDVALNYLPDEQADADRIREIIEREGRKAVLLPGDLTDKALCSSVVSDTVDGLGGLAMFRITKAALAHLTPGSTIINTTSIEAYQPAPNLLDYASAKAAINNFTKGLAQQLATKGIRVNAVAPGPIWTPLQVSDGQEKEDLPKFDQVSPMGRAGQPTELAPAYVFFTSSESSYVIGETLHVNGGMPTP
ncbi:SDR family oxidoreductase [uncultured Dietzia sp.]|uniref:SDR family oxidoreductase n=1 Tax=uncultured Dietzia sp. TaxID=395519 RepID=UPI0025F78983|nr:SDR family oxidoreductase [uncultured Dietzia sp.]